MAVSRRRPSVKPDSLSPRFQHCSSTRGVNAPCSLLLVAGVEERDLCASSRVGDCVEGVEILLTSDDPRVATIDGDDGGSGERVK